MLCLTSIIVSGGLIEAVDVIAPAYAESQSSSIVEC
jgi:hypothetical protein